MRVSGGRSASCARALNARPSSEERSLDEGRNRRRRLQLNVPLGTADVWTNRVVLNLQLEQRRQASAFAHLAYLWPEPERPSLTSARLPIHPKLRLGPEAGLDAPDSSESMDVAGGRLDLALRRV